MYHSSHTHQDNSHGTNDSLDVLVGAPEGDEPAVPRPHDLDPQEADVDDAAAAAADGAGAALANVHKTSWK